LAAVGGLLRRPAAWGVAWVLLAAVISFYMVGQFRPRAEGPAARWPNPGIEIEPVGEILGPVAVIQEVVPESDGLIGVGVVLSTGGRSDLPGEVIVRLKANPGYEEDLAVYRRPLAEIKDGELLTVRFGPLFGVAGKRLFLVVGTSGASRGRTITALRTRTEAYPQGRLFVNGRPTPGDLAFKLEYSRNATEIWATITGSQIGVLAPALLVTYVVAVFSILNLLTR
jgi:hypothetical protein